MNVRGSMLLIGFLLGSGCSQSEGQRAERQYEIVLQSYPSKPERCAEQRKVADAYLRDENLDEYKMWDLKADMICNEADIDALRP